MNTLKVSWRIPAIDGLRALACMMVYGYHVWQFGYSPSLVVPVFGHSVNLLGMFPGFPAGVDLFMVLSGFCLFWPLCKSHEALENWDWREYAWRRVRRIVPPYYAAILYTIVLPMVLVTLFRLFRLEANWQPVPSARQILTHVFLIHTLFPDTWKGITGAFWSLGLEAQFYLVFPFVVFAFRRWKLAVLAVMVASSIIYRVIATQATWGADFDVQMVASIFFIGRWMQFAAGMAAAWWVAAHYQKGSRFGAWWGTSFLLAAVGLYFIATATSLPDILPALPVRDGVLSVAFFLGIVAVCASRTPVRLLFENRLAAGLGLFSYSVFLVHQPTAWYLSEMFKKKLHVGGLADFFLLMTVGVLIICGISYVFFLFIEKPFMGAPKRTKPASMPVGSLAMVTDRQQFSLLGQEVAPGDACYAVKSNGKPSLAVVALVGPGTMELERLHRMLRSVFLHECHVRQVILIDDTQASQLNVAHLSVPPGVQISVLKHERDEGSRGILDGMCIGMLQALRHLARSQFGVDAVLKMDTDALVIQPFAGKLGAFLARQSQLGTAGVVDLNCDGSPRDWRPFDGVTSHMARMFRIQRHALLPRRIVLWGRWNLLRNVIRRARANGYRWGEHAQGGSYLISRRLIEKMDQLGYLDHGKFWHGVYMSEDVMMGLYSRACGMQNVQFAGHGEVFAISHHGLPFSPEDLVRFGYSIIHSVKSNDVGIEQELANYFERDLVT